MKNDRKHFKMGFISIISAAIRTTEYFLLKYKNTENRQN